MYITKKLGSVETEQKAENRLALCSFYVQTMKRQMVARLLWEYKHPGSYSNMVGELKLHEKVVAAMSVQAHELLKALLSQLTTYHDPSCLPVQSPLVASVLHHDQKILSIVLEHVAVMQAQRPRLSVDDISTRIAP